MMTNKLASFILLCCLTMPHAHAASQQSRKVLAKRRKSYHQIVPHNHFATALDLSSANDDDDVLSDDSNHSEQSWSRRSTYSNSSSSFTFSPQEQQAMQDNLARLQYQQQVHESKRMIQNLSFELDQMKRKMTEERYTLGGPGSKATLSQDVRQDSSLSSSTKGQYTEGSKAILFQDVRQDSSLSPSANGQYTQGSKATLSQDVRQELSLSPSANILIAAIISIPIGQNLWKRWKKKSAAAKKPNARSKAPRAVGA
jgi:hypothetical protein